MVTPSATRAPPARPADTKVNQDNVEKVRYQSVERRGFNKGRVNTQITGNYSRCRQCAAAAR
jgi:hypothetical protein